MKIKKVQELNESNSTIDEGLEGTFNSFIFKK